MMDGQQALDIITKTGRNRPPQEHKGGRPKRAEVAALAETKAELEKQIRKLRKPLAKHYLNRAFVSDRVLTHVVERVIPVARPELGPGEAAFLVGAGMILADYLLNRGKVPLDVVSEPGPDIITTLTTQ